jgi:CBS domain-containing protein
MVRADRDGSERAVKVQAILRSKGGVVHTVLPWSRVDSALARMAGPPAIGAVVVTRGERIVGLLTGRDTIRGLLRHGQGLPAIRVQDVMSPHVPTCTPAESLTEVMRTMTRTRFRHLPVIEQGRMVGLVSIGDVVRARLEEMELEAAVLRDLTIARR